MADFWTLATLSSGVVIAGLGLVLLSADPRRDWNRVFAVFAVFWGLQIVAANSVRLLADPALARPIAFLSLALLIPLYFFLVVFASIYPRPSGRFATSLGALLLLLVPAAVDLVILVVAPEWLLADVVPTAGGGSTMRWGPLFAPLVLAPLYGGFYYALFVMMRRLSDAEDPIGRRQVLLVLVALGIFVAYNVPLQSLLFGVAALGGVARDEAVSSVAAWIGGVMFVGLGLLGLLGVRLGSMWRHAASTTQNREMRATTIALAVAAAVGFAEAAVVLLGGPRLAATGLVRIVSVGLIVYGVARYQLFDLDLKVKDATRLVTTALFLAAGGVGLWAIFRGFGAVPTAGAWLTAGGVAIAAIPVAILVRRLVDTVAPDVSRHGDHLYLRKLEVYGVALSAAGWPAAEDTRMTRLRERLDLGDEDHAIAARLAAERTGEAQALAPGVVAFDRYLLEDVLGEGAYGRVFLARDLRSGRRVAVKELETRWRSDPAVLSRFLREARAMARLDHRHVVRLYDVERRGADQFLVLEHVAGGSLAESLAEGAMPRDEALRLVDEVLDGLQAAHERGVVHRDLKPANVLLDRDGRAKVADFGVAMVRPTAEATFDGLPAPEEERPVGNLLYMAPEQLKGTADGRSDTYAVGAMLYHMLTGRPHRALQGLGTAAARDLVATDVLPDLTGFDAQVRAVLAATLVPEPAGRAADAETVRRLVQKATAARETTRDHETKPDTMGGHPARKPSL